MSHDRGCFQCGREQWEYLNCPEKDCAKEGLKTRCEDCNQVIGILSKETICEGCSAYRDHTGQI